MSSKDIADWNIIAATYTQQVGGDDDRIYKQFEGVLWNLLGELNNKAVLDVGCGHGWLSHKFGQAGASVIGVDGSSALLEQAAQNYSDITFVEHDLNMGLPTLEPQFDVAVAHMVLMDLPDIEALLRDLKRVLKPTGKFIFTMPHPCFFNYKMQRDAGTGQPFRAVTGYHKEEIWRLESFGRHNHYHRSLSYYFEKLRGAGFAVTCLFEPEHIPSAESELADFWRSIPVFILIEAVSLSK